MILGSFGLRRVACSNNGIASAISPSRILHLPRLALLYRQVLEWRGVWETGDPTESARADPRPDPAEKGELPDRRVDRLLVYELLHLGQDHLALFRVEFVGLLQVKLVDFRITAVHVRAALDDERGQPRRGVAERAARAAQYALV